ncbi:hypothetical protein Bpfe_007348 [Biomphalaria pfeifferi]|uniref:Uncharacterized protein n=1 Tax=Biomphalaria pfeifferi TaxID=112525 RepID=A0AAD8FFJ8_BIOPF|nr:hypothetical protein Bpfe_007348 [Biomphalaria pfeifferi]
MGMESQSKLNKLLSKRTKKKPDLVLDLGTQFQKSEVPTLPKRNGDVILYPVDSNGELILSPRAKQSAVSTQAGNEFSKLKGAKSNAKVSTSTDPPEIPRRHLLGDFNKATGQKVSQCYLFIKPSSYARFKSSARTFSTHAFGNGTTRQAHFKPLNLHTSNHSICTLQTTQFAHFKPLNLHTSNHSICTLQTTHLHTSNQAPQTMHVKPHTSNQAPLTRLSLSNFMFAIYFVLPSRLHSYPIVLTHLINEGQR